MTEGPDDFDDDIRLACVLRLEPGTFQDIVEGRRTALLLEDSGFAEGGLLVLREWCSGRRSFTHRWLARVVTGVARDISGLAEGFVLVSLGSVDAKPVQIQHRPRVVVMPEPDEAGQGEPR
jgi:hypothetical protein